MKLVPLDELATFMSGSTPARKSPEYFGGGIPWVKTTDLNNGLILHTEETLTQLGIENSSCKMVPPGAVLVAMYGGFRQIGRTGLLTQACAINQALTAIIPKDGLLDSSYLLEWLNLSVNYWKRFAGSSRKDPNITKADVADFPVPLLPISQQRACAAIISEWSQATITTERLIAAKQKLLRAYQHRHLDEAKWHSVRISDLFDPVTRKVDKDETPVATISAGRGFLMQQDRFNRILAGLNLANYTALRRGEFAYNKGNSKTYEFGCVYQLTAYPELAIPNVYVSFTPKVQLVPEFYALWFEADMLKPQLRRVVNSGVRNDGLLNINAETFFSLTVPHPPLPQQESITRAFLAIKREVALLGMQLDVLRKQKRGLMKKLLTGEWLPPICNNGGTRASICL